MKKLLFIILGLLTLSPGSYAESLDRTQARIIAKRYFPDVNLVYEHASSSVKSASVAFYVFENQGDGFVIVSAEDSFGPVLGYSDKGSFPSEDIPSNVSWWLEMLAGAVDEARSGSLVPCFKSSFRTPVLLQTATWGQGEPYNGLVMDKGYGEYTGCGPTAMSIILRYFKHPSSCSALAPSYYYTKGNGVTVTIPSYQIDSHYDYGNMPLNYFTVSNGYYYADYTQSQADEVSQLMFDCGMLLQAMYEDSGTGTYSSNFIPALVNYMDYDASMKGYYKENFSTPDWLDMIYRSISDGSPVWYSGVSSSGGHTFIADGFDSEGNIHINWGWDGAYDGYFVFPDLGDSDSGVYDSNHFAIFGIKPDEGGTAEDIIAMTTYGSDNGLAFTGSDQVTVGQPFGVTFGFLYNAGFTTFNGSVALMTVDRSDRIKEELYSFVSEELSPGYGYSGFEVTCTVTQPIIKGDRIRLYYKSSGSSDWKPVLCDSEEGMVCELYLTSPYYLGELISLEYSPYDKVLTVSTHTDLTLTLVSSSGEAVYDGAMTADSSVNLTIGQSGTYTLSASGLEETCSIKLTF